MAKRLPSKGKIRTAAREVKRKEPAIVKKTRGKKGVKAARKQKIAIILNKARRA